jgi:hypothetical protein
MEVIFMKNSNVESLFGLDISVGIPNRVSEEKCELFTHSIEHTA